MVRRIDAVLPARRDSEDFGCLIAFGNFAGLYFDSIFEIAAHDWKCLAWSWNSKPKTAGFGDFRRILPELRIVIHFA